MIAANRGSEDAAKIISGNIRVAYGEAVNNMPADLHRKRSGKFAEGIRTATPP